MAHKQPQLRLRSPQARALQGKRLQGLQRAVHAQGPQ